MRGIFSQAQCAVGICVLCLMLGAGSAAAEPLPSTGDILNQMEQARSSLDNFRGYFTTVWVSDPYFDSHASGVPPAHSAYPNLISGKDITIIQTLIVYRAGSAYVDKYLSKLTRAGLAGSREREWADGSTRYFELGQSTTGSPAVNENDAAQLDLSDMADLQVFSSKLPGESSSAELSRLNARVVDREEYTGLACLRLAFDIPSSGGVSVSGFRLVCPSRGYEVLYSEDHATTTDPKSSVCGVVSKKSVCASAEYDGTWVPVATRWDQYRLYVGVDAPTLVLQQLFSAGEFRPGYVNDGSILRPLFSPGTVVARTDAPPEYVGGDTRGLVQSLQSGDFSSLSAIATPTSK